MSVRTLHKNWDPNLFRMAYNVCIQNRSTNYYMQFGNEKAFKNMARKTFISYKYSDVVEGHENDDNLRDGIIRALGEDAQYYNGEDSFTDDLSSLKAATIQKRLSNMLYDTSVLILIISPNMKKSKWIEWELSYALKEETRNGRTSHPNGVVAVIQNNSLNGDYPSKYWFVDQKTGFCRMEKTFGLVKLNMGNLVKNAEPPFLNEYKCYRDYISIYSEDYFLNNLDDCIEYAYTKAQYIDQYRITKQR